MSIAFGKGGFSKRMRDSTPDFKPVYILGAGASAMLGAPLVKDFLARARELMYSPRFRSLLPEPLLGRLEEAFESVFRYHGSLLETRKYLGIDLGNIETLFSILDMDIQTSEVNQRTLGGTGEQSSPELQKLRENFFTLIVATLKASTNYSEGSFDTYRRIIQRLAANNGATFITLNYDLAIEKALQHFDARGMPDYIADYRTSEQENMNKEVRGKVLLKLHGSVNWTYCEKCKTLKSFPDEITPLELEGNRHLCHAMNCIEKAQNVLIPPTWYKYNTSEVFTRIWARAIEEISKATHLLMIGYSFPRTDAFFDQLLTLALKKSKNLKQVYVVNTDKNIEEVLGDLFDKHFLSRSVVSINRKFEEFFDPMDMSMAVQENTLESYIWRLHHKSLLS
jgi:NAD-dependent SIR2 family protein deacetylase